MKKNKTKALLYCLTFIVGFSSCNNSSESEMEPDNSLPIIGEWRVTQALSESCFEGGCNEAELGYFLGMKFTQNNAWFYYKSGVETDSFNLEVVNDSTFILKSAVWEGTFVIKYYQGDSAYLSNVMELSGGTIHDQYFLEKGAWEEPDEPISAVELFSLSGEWDIIRAWSETCNDTGCHEFELSYLNEIKFTPDSAWFYEHSGMGGPSTFRLESLNDSTFNLISDSWQGTFIINYLRGDSTYLSNRFYSFHDQYLLKRK